MYCTNKDFPTKKLILSQKTLAALAPKNTQQENHAPHHAHHERPDKDSSNHPPVVPSALVRCRRSLGFPRGPCVPEKATRARARTHARNSTIDLFIYRTISEQKAIRSASSKNRQSTDDSTDPQRHCAVPKTSNTNHTCYHNLNTRAGRNMHRRTAMRAWTPHASRTARAECKRVQCK